MRSPAPRCANWSRCRPRATSSSAPWRMPKSACGMAEYQVRGWLAWHHHMALVLVAHLFLAKERLALRDSRHFLSCLDVVEMPRHKLPSKIGSDEDLVASIAQRHQRRFEAAKRHYHKHGLTPPASFGEVI